jgi:hypothetical protein
MATNELGHKLRALVGDQTTLGAYRGGNRGVWLPGATIDTWVPCARGEIVTGVPFPHVYFIQTIGETGAEGGSIYCPTCRPEVAARRAQGSSAPPLPLKKPAPAVAPKAVDPGQSDLPF